MGARETGDDVGGDVGLGLGSERATRGFQRGGFGNASWERIRGRIRRVR